MIERDLADRLRDAAAGFPCVTLTGPRQSGKSTLCRAVFPDLPYASLEAPDVRSFASDDPRGFLAGFPDGAVIDEVQRCPDLPSFLQGLIDDDPRPGKWILTGSQNLSLLDRVSQSLAGRTAVLHLLPLTRDEIGRFEEHPAALDDTMVAGGYPAIFDRRLPPSDWIGSYVATYVERDVRTLTRVGDLASFQRFLQLCAGRTSQLLNLSTLATDCGISQPTAKSWLSILDAGFIAYRLQPRSGNVRKRVVKTPKLQFYDTGLVCWLLGIRSADQLRSHPLRGAIFETWVVSEIAKHRANRGETAGLFFFRDRHGLEADLIIDEGGSLTVLETKSGKTITSDMLSSVRRVVGALAGTGRVDPVVVHGGSEHRMWRTVDALPWSKLHKRAW